METKRRKRKLPKPYFETKLGKLYHGDCIDIMPLLPEVDLVLTDPPYGVNNSVDSNRFSGGSIKTIKRRGCTRGKFKKKITGDDAVFDVAPFLCFPKVILWGANNFRGLPVGTTLIWIKRNDRAFGTFLSDGEIAWMKGGRGVYCNKVLPQLTQTISSGRLHPNQKPILLMEWCIEKAKLKGNDIILDAYFGSGTTGIVCERLSFKWIGIEIEEKYCEIAAKRIEREVRLLDSSFFSRKEQTKKKGKQKGFF